MSFYPSSLPSWVFEHDCLGTCAVLGALYACVIYFCICTCSAQVSMFPMERRSRNTIIISPLKTVNMVQINRTFRLIRYERIWLRRLCVMFSVKDLPSKDKRTAGCLPAQSNTTAHIGPYVTHTDNSLDRLSFFQFKATKTLSQRRQAHTQNCTRLTFAGLLPPLLFPLRRW